jgi:hypothetical protein
MRISVRQDKMTRLRGGLFCAVVLAIAVITWGQPAVGATETVKVTPSTSQTEEKQEVTLVDPFALKIVSMSQVRCLPRLSLPTNRPRVPIRIPFRPSLRSAFQPSWCGGCDTEEQ